MTLLAGIGRVMASNGNPQGASIGGETLSLSKEGLQNVTVRLM